MTRLVHWHEGMFMRVQNLQMMQQGMLERIEGLRSLQHHYPYGIIEAVVARDALQTGKLRFERLRAVFRNGVEIEAPAECDLPALPLQEELARSRSGEVTVLLGVPDYLPNSQNAFHMGERPDSRTNFRYVPDDEARLDENTGDNKQTVIVRRLNARLLFDSESRAGLECLPVARVRRIGGAGAAGFRVELAHDFVPPCLCLPAVNGSNEPKKGSGASTSPVDYSLPHRLAEEVHLAVQRVEVARRQLAARLHDQRLGMAAMQGAQFQKWIRLLVLSRHASRMLTLEQSLCATPFEMFLELYETLSELESVQPKKSSNGSAGTDKSLKYDHEDPYSCFSRLRVRLEKVLEEVGGVEFHEAAFQIDPAVSNRVRVGLGPEFFGANVAAHYLAIQTAIAIGTLEPVVKSEEKFELTTPERIGQAFGGLKLVHEPSPPAGLPYAPDLHYFKVESRANATVLQLWNDVEASGQLAINRNNPDLPDIHDAVFIFYAVLRPKPLSPNDAD